MSETPYLDVACEMLRSIDSEAADVVEEAREWCNPGAAHERVVFYLFQVNANVPDKVLDGLLSEIANRDPDFLPSMNSGVAALRSLR